MKKGFTLIELVVVFAILVAVAVVGTLNLYGSRGKNDLDSATKNIAALLREAQSNSMAQARSVPWGVHFENATATAPFYALFTSTYSTSTMIGYYRLPASVAYVTSTLTAGSSTNITFSQITGAASASTTIGLFISAQPSLSSTIAISSSGAVGY